MEREEEQMNKVEENGCWDLKEHSCRMGLSKAKQTPRNGKGRREYLTIRQLQAAKGQDTNIITKEEKKKVEEQESCRQSQPKEGVSREEQGSFGGVQRESG